MIRIASEFGFTPASRAKLIPEKATSIWRVLDPLEFKAGDDI